MDLWLILLLLAAMAGIMGWTVAPFTNGVLWFCDWREGTEINWGFDLVLTIAVPFAWMFALLEIVLLYFQ